MENSEISHFESKEKEPEEVVGRYYFFRHNKPVYSTDLEKMVTEHGYAPEKYAPAKYEEKDKISKKSDKKHHPNEKQLGKMFRRSVSEKHNRGSQAFDLKTDTEDRMEFEGGVQELKERKNLESLAKILKQEKVAPFIFIGPRTRHGFSAESIKESLKGQDVNTDKIPVAITDMLSDLNKHWIYILEAAKEEGVENPWELILNPKYQEKLKEKGIETMKEISERTKQYLGSLEKMFKAKKDSDLSLEEKSPVFMNITSDFNQFALLKSLGIEKIQEKPISDFRPAIGSSIEIEVLANDTANIYYQLPEQDNPELLATVEDFHEKIREEN